MVKNFEKRRDLGKLDFTRMGRGINIYNPSPDQIIPLLSEADEQIGGLTEPARVIEIYEHNPESIFVIRRSNSKSDEPSGFLAQLPLNEEGHEALFTGELDTAAPDIKYICRQNEMPSAIYSWCIFVNPRIAGGISLVFERFSSPKNIGAPIYCRAANENARKFFLSIGFRFNPTYKGISVPDLMEYERESGESNPTPVPNYDSFRQKDARENEIGVSVVHSIEGVMQVAAVRAATYMAEHECPYEEEFDGNDFCCTHLLGHVGATPAGCLRIRFFSSFAKIERLAVIKKARKTKLSNHLIKAALELCRKKGYRHVYGHSDEKILPLWKRHGFKPRTEESTFSFSGLNCFEGDLELSKSNNVIGLDTDPMVINRPEGQWHKQGILEM